MEREEDPNVASTTGSKEGEGLSLYSQEKRRGQETGG